MGWVIKEIEEEWVAYSLPGDRDNAFLKLEGVIPSLISHKSVEPLVRPFKKVKDYIPGLVYPVNVYFFKNTPKGIYITKAKFLQRTHTDQKLTAALKNWNKDFMPMMVRQ